MSSFSLLKRERWTWTKTGLIEMQKCSSWSDGGQSWSEVTNRRSSYDRAMNDDAEAVDEAMAVRSQWKRKQMRSQFGQGTRVGRQLTCSSRKSHLWRGPYTCFMRRSFKKLQDISNISYSEFLILNQTWFVHIHCLKFVMCNIKINKNG
jgi:hypothetical protein